MQDPIFIQSVNADGNYVYYIGNPNNTSIASRETLLKDSPRRLECFEYLKELASQMNNEGDSNGIKLTESVGEFSANHRNLIEGILEEGHYKTVLEMIESFVNPKNCPPAELMSDLIKKVLLDSNPKPEERDIPIHTYSTLKRLQKIHNPAFSPAAWSPLYEAEPWSWMQSLIDQIKITEEDSFQRGFLLLQYVVSIFQDDFVNHRLKLKDTMLYSILGDQQTRTRAFLEAIFTMFSRHSLTPEIIEASQLLINQLVLLDSMDLLSIDLKQELFSLSGALHPLPRITFFTSLISLTMKVALTEHTLAHRYAPPRTATGQSVLEKYLRMPISLDKFYEFYFLMTPFALANELDDPGVLYEWQVNEMVVLISLLFRAFSKLYRPQLGEKEKNDIKSHCKLLKERLDQLPKAKGNYGTTDYSITLKIMAEIV